MSSSAEFYFRASQAHLEAAQYCYDGKQFGVAIAEAYHSVLASVKVRPRKKGKEAPDRHSRSLSHLYHEFVENGDVDREVSSFIHKVPSYRDDWNYEAVFQTPPKRRQQRLST